MPRDIYCSCFCFSMVFALVPLFEISQQMTRRSHSATNWLLFEHSINTELQNVPSTPDTLHL